MKGNKPRSPKWVMGCTEILVKDFPRAREFYVDRLGLPVEQEEPGRYVMLRAGKMLLCVDREDAQEPARGGGATLFFIVKSISSVAKELERSGIQFEPHSYGKSQYLEAYDPEGYKLVFTKSVV